MEPQIKEEYTRLLYSFYGRAQILGFPFALFIFFIFYGKVNLVASLFWLFTIFATHALQMLHAKHFHQAQLRSCHLVLIIDGGIVVRYFSFSYKE